ncbi:SDR family NAD(P)-dependent oxidoreductase [Rhodococcus wratislaviensis]|uniref:3-oxoacyl-[acyl-carrier-protein] reductase n=1 Tax=Rhodococcus wratislaviensis NBRC 100605 TaxID=1219028 RepID=X0PXT5_RHOWR|nr:SDR family oxidoreductase [Rhodococcus wratislaviensis]GAF43187.1 hypothetical protein RW1_006_00810 [Rhodococcus wratislaviensis NBRC 100605]
MSAPVAVVTGVEGGLGGAVTRRQRAIDDLDLATWIHTLSVNLTGTVLCAIVAMDELRRTGGAIVTIGSQLGYTGGINCAAYAASKAGVSGLTRALARQLGPDVRVNCVAPGPIETPMTAAHATPEWVEQKTQQQVMKRFGTADEVATAVSWVAGTDASFVTGQTIHVNGGGVMP